MSIVPFALALASALPGPANTIQPARTFQEGGDVPAALLAHAELSAEVARLADQNPDLVTRHLVGRSRDGRAIEALRFAAPGTETGALPGLLLVANLEGPRVFESSVALHHARKLVEGFAGGDEGVTSLLETTEVWILPRANPDAAEAAFQTPRRERWAGSTGVDDDRDGRQGEDPPQDVDGDGLVTRMRVPDPDGEWMPDPTDERALVRADRSKGERGIWELHPEGRDLDGDERVAEDPAGNTRVDKNFASGWEQHAPHAGVFPTDEPEARALAEFVMQRKNLALVVTYDGLDTLVEKPKEVDDDAPPVLRVPPEGVLASDAELLAELGRRYKDATDAEATGMSSDAGTFSRWCYDHRGLLVLDVTLWNLPTEAPADETADEEAEDARGRETEEDEEGDAEAGGEEAADMDAERPLEKVGEGAEPDGEGEERSSEPSEDAKHLRWIDAVGEDWRFVPWTTFQHPELGEVEIGGFAPFARLLPPDGERADLADRHFDFFTTLGELLPRVEIAECTKKALGPGVWEVEAVVRNDSYLPLLTRSMQRTRTTRPARVRFLYPEEATLLSGSPQELLTELPGSGGREEYTWLVHGPGEMELGVSVDTDHAGDVVRMAEVAR